MQPMMPQGQPALPLPQGAQPQGIESILQALALGGQPNGNMSQAGTNPLAGAGAMPPELAQLNPEMLMMIQQALASGAFNGQNQLPNG